MSILKGFNPNTNQYEDITLNHGSISETVTTPLTNTANNVVTQIKRDGVLGKSWYICYVNWRVSGTASVGATNVGVNLKDGTNVIYSSAIPSGSINGTNLSIAFSQPIKITEGSSFEFNIASPSSANCIIYSNIGVYCK